MARRPAAVVARRLAGAVAWWGVLACGAAGDPAPEPTVHVVVDAAVPRGHPEGPVVVPVGARVVASGDASPVAFAVETLTVGRLYATSETRLAGGRPVRWRIRTALASEAGDTVWRSVDDVLLRPDGPREVVHPTLARAGADVRLALVQVGPRDTTLVAGDSLRLRAGARDADGFTIVDAALGWRSRDAATVTVSERGVVRAVAPGLARVVARAWNGVADSTTVRVVARP